MRLVTEDEAEEALCEAELTREMTELEREERALEMDPRSEPVAVESSDCSDEATLPASLVMEFTTEVTCERMDEASEVACDWMELISIGLVRVAVWAATEEASAARMIVKRMFDGGVV